MGLNAFKTLTLGQPWGEVQWCFALLLNNVCHILCIFIPGELALGWFCFILVALLVIQLDHIWLAIPLRLNMNSNQYPLAIQWTQSTQAGLGWPRPKQYFSGLGQPKPAWVDRVWNSIFLDSISPSRLGLTASLELLTDTDCYSCLILQNLRNFKRSMGSHVV